MASELNDGYSVAQADNSRDSSTTVSRKQIRWQEKPEVEPFWNINMRYKELFSTQEFGQAAYAAVIVDLDTFDFYHALMEECHVGGYYSYKLKDSGNPISLGEVKKLAIEFQEIDPRRAKRYICISDENLKDLLVGD